MASVTDGQLTPTRLRQHNHLNTRHEVSLPVAGEVVSLQDSGRRRGAFINPTPKKLEALKEKHARGKVQVRYDALTHEVRIALPENVAGALFGEGEYTLEVLRGKLSRIKLSERDLEIDQVSKLEAATE